MCRLAEFREISQASFLAWQEAGIEIDYPVLSITGII